MRNFKRFVAFVLCAVMLVGLAPVTFDNAKVVANTTETNTETNTDTTNESTDNTATDDGWVEQGSKDAVVFVAPRLDNGNPVTSTTFAGYFNRLTQNQILYAGKFYGPTKNGTTRSAADKFDRIIVVLVSNISLGSDDFSFKFEGTGAKELLGFENIVLTSKCKVTNTSNCWVFFDAASKMKTYADYITTEGALDLLDDNNVANFHDNTAENATNVKFTMPAVGFAEIRFYCNIEFDYIILHFPNTNPVFYCQGHNFTVGENVKFTFSGDSTAAGYRPIVVNGSYEENSFNPNALTESEKNKQTIKLLGGEYQYIFPRIRLTDTEQSTSEKNIFIELGAVKFVKKAPDAEPSTDANYTAIIAYEDYSGCNFDVKINGTVFDSPFFIIGSRQASKAGAVDNPTISGCKVDISIKDATFNHGIGFRMLENIPAEKTGRLQYNSVDLDLKVTVDGVTLAEDQIICGGDADLKDVTSTITCDPFEIDALRAPGFGDYYTPEATECADGAHSEFGYVRFPDAVAMCKACYHEIAPEMTDGLPTIYVSNSGANTKLGLTEDAPVQKIWRAFEILSNWNMGGYIKIVGGKITVSPHASFGSGSGAKWVNCGDKVVIDGKYGTNTQALMTCTSDHVQIFNDVEFKNIQLAKVTNHKAFTLNYYSFTAVENCSMANTSNYNYSLMLGSTNGYGTVTDYARYRVVDQTVKIDGFNFMFISAGSKSFERKDDKVSTCYFSLSREYSQHCSGTSNVYIGSNSKIQALNVRENYYDDADDTHKTGYTQPTTTFYINSNAVDLSNVKFAQIQSSGAYKLNCDYSAKYNFVNPGLWVIGDNYDNMHSKIRIVDSNNFEEISTGFRTSTDDSAIRITYQDVDSFLQKDNIVEFGVLMTAVGNAENIAYVPTAAEGDKHFANGVAKSICYGNGSKAYYYNGTDPVKFHGVLAFGDLDMTDPDNAGFSVVAAPYAVIKVAKDENITGTIDGTYAVIGEVSESFSYQLIKDKASAATQE